MGRPDDLKYQVEHATAQNFIQWHNEQNGRNLTLLKKQEAPDFIYSDHIGQIGLEVTTIFYNKDHAEFTATAVRGQHKTNVISPVIREPEESLVKSINMQIAKKCENDYGKNSLLVIRVILPALTSNREFEEHVISQIIIPDICRFKEIYLTWNQQNYFKLPLTNAARIAASS